MAQTEIGWPLSLSLSAKNWTQTKSRANLALPSLWPRVGARVALQRGPILRTSVKSLPRQPIPPFQRGHLYFAE